MDNFHLIAPLLKFDSPDEFYFVQVIQRKNDRKNLDMPVKYVGSNNHSRLIKAYYIYSAEQLERYKPEIVSLCNMFMARAGINLNRRNQRDVSLEMLELLARDIRCGNFGTVSKIYNSVCGSVKSIDKTWVVDLDQEGSEEDFFKKAIEVGKLINSLQPEGDNILAVIPSRSGCHLITKPFNTSEFSKVYPDIEVHKNNPTNLYIP